MKTKIALMLSFCLAGMLRAQTYVPVPNSSFENPVVTGWLGAARYGIANTPQVANAATAPSYIMGSAPLIGATGNQVAYIYADAIYTQSPVLTMQEGCTYTVTADLGAPNYGGWFDNQMPKFLLYDTTTTNSQLLASQAIQYPGAGTPAVLAGSFLVDMPSDDVMRTYTYSYTATAADTGHGLGIMFASGLESDHYVDNVRVTSIPEPSSALLGGIGMLGILRRRCR